jgi:hypothetical protein
MVWRLAWAQNSIRLSALVKSRTFPQRRSAPRKPLMSLVVICCAQILFMQALRRLYSSPINSNGASKDATICQTLSASHSAPF